MNTNICRATVTVTGPSGSGKTLFLDHLKEVLEGNDEIHVCCIDEDMTKNVKAKAEQRLLAEAESMQRLPVLVELIERPA